MSGRDELTRYDEKGREFSVRKCNLRMPPRNLSICTGWSLLVDTDLMTTDREKTNIGVSFFFFKFSNTNKSWLTRSDFYKISAYPRILVVRIKRSLYPVVCSAFS